MILSRINKRSKQLIIRCLFTLSCCPEDHCQTFLSWTKFFETPFIHAFCEQYPCKFRKQDTVLTDSFWEVIRTYCIIIKDKKLSYFSGKHLIALSSRLPLLLGCILHTPLRKRPSFPFSTRFLSKIWDIRATLRIGEALNFTKIVRAALVTLSVIHLKALLHIQPILFFTILHSRKNIYTNWTFLVLWFSLH